jgi:alanine racemase
MSDTARNRAWLELDLAALRHNFQTLQRCAGRDAGVLVMVKADGYGLGAARVVRALEPLHPFAWGVATVEEGAALRSAGVRRDIYVFGPMPPAEVERAAAHGLIATISDLEALRRWAEAGTRHSGLRFHVEIDTGIGRAGFDWRETAKWAPELLPVAAGRAQWAGAFTHFHSADSADAGPSATQWARFQDALAQLPVSRENLLVHAANSAATVRWREYAGDFVRVGIHLYGGDAAAATAPHPPPEPVASLHARIVLIRDVPPGSTVGYGATHVARGWERWATLSIGYGDGLPRALGNRGAALVQGHRQPIVGRISMDMTVVDITGLPEVQVGDAALLIGRDGNEEITVDEVAAQAGTISYEILTGFTPRLPRVERESA